MGSIGAMENGQCGNKKQADPGDRAADSCAVTTTDVSRLKLILPCMFFAEYGRSLF